MRRLTLNICATILGTLALTAAAGSSEVSNKDHARVVALTHQLEREPLGEFAPSARKWLFEWIEKSDDITVIICDLLGPIPSKTHPYSHELLAQMLFSNAAFQIEHSDRRSDKVAAQIAGVVGSLMAYSEIVKTDPRARLPYFDDLLQRHKNQRLEEHLAPIVKGKCGAA